MKWPKSTGAGYASLVQSGMSAMVALVAKPDTTAVYNRSYQQVIRRQNAIEAQHTGEINVAGAKQRGVKERTRIGLVQDIAEANVRANAAAAGMTGDNLVSNIYQTEANASYRLSEQGIGEGNEIDSALAQVYSGSQGKMIPTDDFDSSLMGGIMSGIGTIDSQFMRDLGLAMEMTPTDNTSSLKSTQDIDPVAYSAGSGLMLS